MVDKKITELTNLTTPVSGDVLAIVDDPAGAAETKKVTFGNVESNISHSNITAGDGSDHSNVATNTIHSSGNGSDHADVASNTTHRGLTNPHLDWTADQGATNIHSGNYTDNDTTDHTAFSNIGTNTHVQVDTHLANTSNPHSVDAGDVSLGNVSNVATDDTAYNATSWNTNADAATKNVIRDKVETMDTAIGLNTSKVTNVSTDLSAGTRTATTIKVDSSDGTDATLVEADTTNAGILGSDKWDEVVASSTHVAGDGSDHANVASNTSASHAQNTDTDLDATFEGTFVKKADNVNVLNDISSAGADIEDAVSKRHSQNTDTALGSGAVAADHGTPATDEIINICYGTGAPPTANTTTIGTLFMKYTA